MRKCKFEDLIDDYLLNKLDEDKKQKFEEHYFNCPSCFEKMVERDELISVVRDKRNMLFQDGDVVQEAKGASGFEKIVSLLTPKQWAAAAVSASFLIILGVVFYFIFNPKFRLEDYNLRGPQITIKLDIETVPLRIEWSKAGKDVEYKIYVFDNGKEFWSATTKENFIILSAEVKTRITLGKEYSCKVKAFSPPGSLVASGETSFKILKTE
jgi:hypothetical protein